MPLFDSADRRRDVEQPRPLLAGQPERRSRRAGPSAHGCRHPRRARQCAARDPTWEESTTPLLVESSYGRHRQSCRSGIVRTRSSASTATTFRSCRTRCASCSRTSCARAPSTTPKRSPRWDATAAPSEEISFAPSRVLLQDLTGVPAVVDLAAMRNAMADLGGEPSKINPADPGRARDRPFGPGRCLRLTRRVRPQRRARVRAQPRALPLPALGPGVVHGLQGRAARAPASATR